MSIHNLIQLHREHQYWLHELDLYQDEIKYFQNRLARLAAQETDKEIDEKIGHFRQGFLKTIERIDFFRQQIYMYEVQIAKRMELANRTKENSAPEESHHRLRQQVEEFSLDFKALKLNCSDFISGK